MTMVTRTGTTTPLRAAAGLPTTPGCGEGTVRIRQGSGTECAPFRVETLLDDSGEPGAAALGEC